jgi:hypothetical protein
MNTKYVNKFTFLGLMTVCMVISMGSVYAMNAADTLPTHITVWVHGTRAREFLPVNMHATWRQFEYLKCYCPQGLHTATQLEDALYIKTILCTLTKADPIMFPAEHTYAFGWSGGLHPEKRMRASQELEVALRQLKSYYENLYGYCPLLRFITHSHGGNVVLNLATTIPGNTLHIDELLLLACPVQEKTAHLVESSLFGHIISLYSMRDTVQIVDPQGTHGIFEGIKNGISHRSYALFKQSLDTRTKKFFSGRLFPASNKIKQIKVEWDRHHTLSMQDLAFLGDRRAQQVHAVLQRVDRSQRGLAHSEFILPSFVAHVPIFLRHVNSGGDVSVLKEPFHFTLS